MNATVAGRGLAILGLTGIYLLTLGSMAWGDIVIGFLLAAVVESGVRYRAARAMPNGVPGDAGPRRPPLYRRLIALPALLAVIFREITIGTWHVAQYSLGLKDVTDEGMVWVELDGISREGVALWAFITTLSPGEIVVEADPDRGRLLVHTLDASDPEAIRSHHRLLYERYQRKVVP